MISATRLLVLTAIGITIGTIACTDAGEITGKPPGGALLIESERDSAVEVDTLIVGDEDWLFAKGADTTAVTTWTVGDTSIIRIVDQVFARVHIKALKVGSTTITAEHDGETGTLQIVVRELTASDTVPKVEITTNLDSLIIGDSIPFGFNLVRRGEYLLDRPFTLTLSDSSAVRVLYMNDPLVDPHSFWIEGVRLGTTVLTVRCACVSDSLTITVHEPKPMVPDPRASRYEAIDLGTLGGAAAFPLALNDSGDVVGYSLTATGEQHAFLWTNGVMQDLSPSGAHSEAQVVTNSRTVAGTSEIGGVVHILRWDNGQMTDLGPVGSADRQAGVVGITATDVVAWGDSGSAIWRNGVKEFLGGFRARASNGRHQIAGNLGNVPYLWDNGSLMALEIRGLPSHAVDINNEGVVVGDTPEWTQYWGVRPAITVWVNGRISRTFGYIDPVAINDPGDVIGQSSGSAAFYSRGSVPWEIPSLGGWGGTFPHDLNSLAMVVGESWTAGKTLHAFVWQVSDSTPIDLGTGPITAARNGSSAIAINARGDIVGWVAPCTTPAGRCTELDKSHARVVLWRLKNP